MVLLPGDPPGFLRFPRWLRGKEPACKVGDAGLTPGSERSPGGGKGNPLQYSCLENPMNRGVWQSMGSQRVGHDWVASTSDGFSAKRGPSADTLAPGRPLCSVRQSLVLAWLPWGSQRGSSPGDSGQGSGSSTPLWGNRQRKSLGLKTFIPLAFMMCLTQHISCPLISKGRGWYQSAGHLPSCQTQSFPPTSWQEGLHIQVLQWGVSGGYLGTLYLTESMICS